MVCFFFSSRRRHTRYIGDWSSDVCSSDLVVSFPIGFIEWVADAFVPAQRPGAVTRRDDDLRMPGRLDQLQIGRASCRERVQISVADVALKKTSMKIIWCIKYEI